MTVSRGSGRDEPATRLAGALRERDAAQSVPAVQQRRSLPLLALAIIVVLAAVATAAVFLIAPSSWEIAVFANLAALAVVLLLLRSRSGTEASDWKNTVRWQRDLIKVLAGNGGKGEAGFLWMLDRNGAVVDVSDWSREGPADQLPALGRQMLADLDAKDAPASSEIAEMRRAISETRQFADLLVPVQRGGQTNWWSWSGHPVFSASGTYEGFIGAAWDVSEREAEQQQSQKLAYTDLLTGLPNRAKFTEMLNLAVARLERYGTPFAVLFVDLDRFKSVNDSRGHLIGDKLLTTIGKRIRAALRGHDFAARLGGDEFAIIANEVLGKADLAAVAQRIIDAVSQSIPIDDDVLSVGACVGIAMAPENGTRGDQILRNADLALYRAKSEGGTYRFFDLRMDMELREKRLMDLELREATVNSEFAILFQPIVRCGDRRIVGFEALLRWDHPVRGLVLPSEFISIAEQSRSINEIGAWSLLRSCRVATTWPEDIYISVNISPAQLRGHDIVQLVRTVLEQTGLNPRRLQLEITEAVLIEDENRAREVFDELRRMGVSIALDDFGVGYSGLSYLTGYTFDSLKIDRSLVGAAIETQSGREILRAILSLCNTLNLSTVAEGVEKEEEAVLMESMGVRNVQGYRFGYPVEERIVAELITKQSPEFERPAA